MEAIVLLLAMLDSDKSDIGLRFWPLSDKSGLIFITLKNLVIFKRVMRNFVLEMENV